MRVLILVVVSGRLVHHPSRHVTGMFTAPQFFSSLNTPASNRAPWAPTMPRSPLVVTAQDYGERVLADHSGAQPSPRARRR